MASVNFSPDLSSLVRSTGVEIYGDLLLCASLPYLLQKDLSLGSGSFPKLLPLPITVLAYTFMKFKILDNVGEMKGMSIGRKDFRWGRGR